ncbi:hypothetical protein [Burkholderia stagnalis]|uniref:hypothetical protein n=1 Tax=Burkholderia stagnalis TaxID=1503054 RepID=UPI000751EFED|nr:hypothetical protein [Burkholderia stagnalis]KVO54098.1 hypothetical protein WT18_01990 [Burkholderia stagnalis]KVP07939.1 hypothetical protein WT20_24110 [Burkholderia stagnalis]KVW89728.1 hypothetical protein WT30_27800 [Burkholderia stagnalis]KWH67103.1 hypothetical protein WT66_32920 [Burkholderia stagnalis]KWK16437.1 hypothetical protein WT77_29795 [Burkholderia stagnalis]
MNTIRATGKRIAQAGLVCGALLSGAAHAQLDLQSLGASLLGGGQQQAAAAPAQGAVAQLLQAYVGANQQVLTGQSALASAMGLTGAAGQAQQAASLLGSGGNALTPAALSQMGGAQQSVSQALGQAFASGGGTHGPVDKQAFSNGLASLGQGLTQYSQLQSGLGGLGSTSPAALLQAGLNPQNMQAASYIAQSAPGQLQSLAATLSQAVQFATSQGISVPSVASSALKLLP